MCVPTLNLRQNLEFGFSVGVSILNIPAAYQGEPAEKGTGSG